MAQHQQPNGQGSNNKSKQHVSKYGKPQIDRENKGFKQIDHEKQNQVARKEAQTAKGSAGEENPQINQQHRQDPSSMNKVQERKTAPDLQMDQPITDADAGSQ